MITKPEPIIEKSNDKQKPGNNPELRCTERDILIWNGVVGYHKDQSKVKVKFMLIFLSAYSKKYDKWFMKDRDVIWNRGDRV